MKTISFEKKIHAPIEKVWEILWNDDTYREWTKHFMPGTESHYVSDWQVGGKTLFLGPDQSGMIATITKLDRPYQVIFNHQGEILNGVEGEKYAEGFYEKYLLSETDGITTLTVSVDVEAEYEDHMNEGFTRGLADVKRLAENP